MTIGKPGFLALLGVLGASVLLAASVAYAEPITVRYTEGVTRGFPVIRSVKGEKIAQGELTQVARGDRVESRMVFRFRDGSLYDETVAFAQNGVFTLLSYRLVQHGPSFPEKIEAWVDRATERYEVRYKADEESPEETHRGRITLPGDVYNGLLTTLIKNLAPGASETVQIIAFTPKPRLVKMLLAPSGAEPVLIGESPQQALHYKVKPQLGLFASLLIVDVPDINMWILSGEAPGFLKFEGPLYFMGPIWRIEPN
ncbi:MAG TPA: hypothetical protein VGL09_22855 [Methylomirabilota bacterium]|jgi:hypothetical protein